jgi:hypothetical protein
VTVAQQALAPKILASLGLPQPGRRYSALIPSVVSHVFADGAVAFYDSQACPEPWNMWTGPH